MKIHKRNKSVEKTKTCNKIHLKRFKKIKKHDILM